MAITHLGSNSIDKTASFVESLVPGALRYLLRAALRGGAFVGKKSLQGAEKLTDYAVTHRKRSVPIILAGGPTAYRFPSNFDRLYNNVSPENPYLYYHY